MELGIVVPCYNEQEVLGETASRLIELLERLARLGVVSDESRLWFVDDGSSDGTWGIIEHLSRQSGRVRGIKLSRNRGHQNALLAGLLTASGDLLVSIDADLQDDISVIETMLAEHKNGADIVYGVRKGRETDSVLKRKSAEMFYKFLRIMGVESVHNHADYRLMSRRAIEALRDFTEVNLYLRGLVPLIGFASTSVHYDRTARFAGVSKYPLGRMIALALDAVTSFSVVPLRLITFIGFSVFLITMVITGWVLWVRFFTDQALPGWASTVLPMYFLGGIQILCIGVIGEYSGKIYTEVKRRPRYVIDHVL